MNNPNYYAVIPAVVRYDKRLKANAKLLYGEITALCNKEGFCWATNDYFADLYNVDERTVRRLVVNLKEFGYINIEIDQSNQNPRKIFLTDLRTKLSDLRTKLSEPQDKIVRLSIYSINNTINIPGTGINFLITEFSSRFQQDFLMKYEKQFRDEVQFNQFLEDFNDEVEIQKKDFDQSLFGMLKKYARNWLACKNRNSLRLVKDQEVQPRLLPEKKVI